jgi:hypothetical protein
VISRWATLSPPGRLIDACLFALRRLETKIGETKTGDPPYIFVETGEVLFWLYAIGDTDSGQILSPGFQWARHQYAHGNLITECVEYHPGATVFILDDTPLDEPPETVWTPRESVGTYAKARDHHKLSPKAEAARALQWEDYHERLAGQPVVLTLWNELSELAAIVSPRDLAPRSNP